ncbi:hypothetical protein AWH56_015050 [Anaerobacillus isosaccharinicus]|uniref:Uncharacterized protein n=2 Tax=Anaerobacillus isosaccharinicus TaxID=1532552 RepID=A0A1S2MD97_9BACI|nr:hypothetical protein [Anaerobacillus isosaccharinicus]
MEFPFDLSIIWLSLLLSIVLLMAFIFRSSYLPSFKRQNKLKELNGLIKKVEIPISFFTERLHIVFRKIPTKEIGNNVLDEDQPYSFSAKLYFINLEEEFIYEFKNPIAHVSYT